MRVLHLISSGGMYGAEAVILNLSRELLATGRNASCVATFAHAGQPSPALYQAALDAGIEAETLPCKGQFDPRVVGAVREASSRARADVMHAHGYKADIYARLAFRGHSRPALVSTCHTWYDNDWAVRVYGAIDRWVLRSFDQVVAVSSEVRDRLLRAGVPARRVHLIRNGIGMPRAGTAVRTLAHPGAGSRLRVGLVGRLAPEKGVDVFLRAAARIATALPTVDFVVAGEGPERAALAQLADELGLRERVQLPGALTDMASFYASLDLLVSASRQEGLPMALLEGMASGLPVVATKVGAVPEIVAEDRTGFLVDAADAEALATAMLRLLSDEARRLEFGAAARRRIHEQFSAQRMMEEYLQVYVAALASLGLEPASLQKSGIA